MRRVCCICKTVFGWKEPFDRDEETHGFCPECFEIEMKKIEALREKEMVFDIRDLPLGIKRLDDAWEIKDKKDEEV